MDKPDSVSLVTPPRTTIENVIPAHPSSQYPGKNSHINYRCRNRGYFGKERNVQQTEWTGKGRKERGVYNNRLVLKVGEV